MSKIDTVVFLKSMGVYITDARRMILTAFLEKENALTQAEILRFTNEAIDRVTIWRTLDLFVSKGIIHAIPSMDSLTRYGLLQSKNRADVLITICILCATVAAKPFVWTPCPFLQ